MNATSMLTAGGRFGDYSRGWSVTCWSASTSCPPGNYFSLKILLICKKMRIVMLVPKTISVKMLFHSWGRTRSGWSRDTARDSGCRGICSGSCLIQLRMLKFTIKAMSHFKCFSLAWRLFPSTAISAPILDFLPTRSSSRIWSTCILGKLSFTF